MGWSHAEKIFDPESGYTLQGGRGHGAEGVGAVYPGVDRRRPRLQDNTECGPVSLQLELTAGHWPTALCWPVSRWSQNRFH